MYIREKVKIRDGVFWKKVEGEAFEDYGRMSAETVWPCEEKANRSPVKNRQLDGG